MRTEAGSATAMQKLIYETASNICPDVSCLFSLFLITRPLDALLILLIALLLASLAAFALGVLPYPFGLLILAFLIAARILYLREKDSGDR